MTKFENAGFELRQKAKSLVMDFMSNSFECSKNADGMKLSEIFRACGFDWGTYENATSSNQQYWVVALMRELENEGKVQRDIETKKWRLI